MSDDAERGTQAVHRALRMLESFRDDQPELTLSELADSASLTLPTAHRIARALHARGFLVQGGPEHAYSLGPEVMRLARTLLQAATPHNLIRIVQPYLEQLNATTEETAALHSIVGTERMCVAEVPSRLPMRMANGVGNLYPMHSGAAGKAMLAEMPKDYIDRIVVDHPDEATIRRGLARARRQGYALSLGETIPAAAAVAAAIHAASGSVIGAISLAGPIERWTRERMTEAAPQLIEMAKEIDERLRQDP